MARRVSKPPPRVSKKPPLRVAFAHLDLGIGGAEQLVVNAALALKHEGHAVRIFTTHHSPDHCFAPTRGDGELAASIVVVGDWLPRSVLGRGTALCSTLRMLYLALYMVLVSAWATTASASASASASAIDVVVCDGVSAPLPIFRWGRLPVLFYCHFPDKLLCTARGSWLKRAYRAPLDYLEEATTAMADVVVVNSLFTASIFKQAFPTIARSAAKEPSVLYPVADFASFTPPDWAAKEGKKKKKEEEEEEKKNGTAGMFVSLNRFERKKNVGLAIEALAVLKEKLSSSSSAQKKSAASSSLPRLVVAGGYDPRVAENVAYLKELEALAAEKGVAQHVTFSPSVSDAERDRLLQGASCVVYTPENEHFGIVPVEAMYAGAPVLAADSGGPRETVVDGETGFLRPNTPEAFAGALAAFVDDPGLSERLGRAANAHVTERFGMETFARQLDDAVRRARATAAAADELPRSLVNGWLLGPVLLVVISGYMQLTGAGDEKENALVWRNLGYSGGVCLAVYFAAVWWWWARPAKAVKLSR